MGYETKGWWDRFKAWVFGCRGTINPYNGEICGKRCKPGHIYCPGHLRKWS